MHIKQISSYPELHFERNHASDDLLQEFNFLRAELFTRKLLSQGLISRRKDSGLRLIAEYQLQVMNSLSVLRLRRLITKNTSHQIQNGSLPDSTTMKDCQEPKRKSVRHFCR